MLAIISPAKTLDYSSPFDAPKNNQIHFSEEVQYLVKKIAAYSPKRIAKLMNVSEEIANLNFKRFQNFQSHFDSENSRPALFAFKGDVYLGLDAYSLNNDALLYAETQARILSGLYGLLRPLDLIQPYRLEMGLPFKVTPSKSNLYKFWGDKIKIKLEEDIEESKGEACLINLASGEYNKAAKLNTLKFPVYEMDFREKRPDGSYKTIGFSAKKARGMMLRFIIDNKIEKADDLRAFDIEGYSLNNNFTEGNKFVFTRDN